MATAYDFVWLDVLQPIVLLALACLNFYMALGNGVGPFCAAALLFAACLFHAFFDSDYAALQAERMVAAQNAPKTRKRRNKKYWEK